MAENSNCVSVELDKRDISELRSFANPPKQVIEVLAVTALLLGHPKKHIKDWKFLKSLVAGSGDQSLQQRVSKLDINSIPEGVALEARDIIENIDVDMVKMVNPLAHTLCRWNEDVIIAVLEAAESKKT